MMHKVKEIAIQQSSEDILRDPANRLLLGAANHFASLLIERGFPARAYSESAIQTLAGTLTSTKEQIASSFENWCQWIEPIAPGKFCDNEIELLLRTLDKHGFEADEEFLKTIQGDQIIEFYCEDMVQRYRSFNFYKITGYSLLDISLHEWYVLWDRPKQIAESIALEISDTLETYIPVKQFKTGKHLVREVFNASQSEYFEPRAAMLTPLCLGSLKPKKFSSNKKKGFICSSLGEMIAIGKEAENIQFI